MCVGHIDPPRSEGLRGHFGVLRGGHGLHDNEGKENLGHFFRQMRVDLVLRHECARLAGTEATMSDGNGNPKLSVQRG